MRCQWFPPSDGPLSSQPEGVDCNNNAPQWVRSSVDQWPKDEKLNDMTKDVIFHRQFTQCLISLINCEPKSRWQDDRSCLPMLIVLPEASVTYGSLMCLECSGQHRSLGVGSSDRAPHRSVFPTRSSRDPYSTCTLHWFCGTLWYVLMIWWMNSYGNSIRA